MRTRTHLSSSRSARRRSFRRFVAALFAVLLGLAQAKSALNDFVALRVDGRAEFEQLGRTVASVGDVNGDGVPDFGAGLVTAGEGGDGNAISARIFSGATGALLYAIPRPPNTCVESINSVAGAGDLNGDGRAEFMVGTPRTSRIACGVGDHAGIVRIFSGATGAIFSQRFGDPDDLLGWSVAGVGDVNGDGTPDLLMGAPGAGAGAGRVDLFAGTVAGALLAQATGEAAGDAFGWSVAPAGNVNGDARPDVLVGAPFARGIDESQGQGAGRAYVYVWLTPGGFTRHFTVMGDGRYNALGYAVAGAGDVNGDGRAEFVAGAPGGVSDDGPVAPGDGYARLYSGIDASVVLRTWGGEAPGLGPHHRGDLLGYAVAALGDCDGDGRIEIAVGAPQTGNGHGAVYLFRPNSDVPARIHLGDEAGDFLGVALASAGDVWAKAPNQQELLTGASGTTAHGHAGAGSVFVLACHPVPKPDIAVSPVQVNLGDVSPGATGTRLVTIRNEGSASLTIGAIGLGAGAHPAITLGALPALPLVLGPNASAILAVQFAPATLSPASARLEIASDDPDEPEVFVPIGGRGVGVEIEVVPGTVAFGEVRVGDWISAVVTVRNVGNLALGVTSLAVAVGSEVFSVFPTPASSPAQRVVITGVEMMDERIRFTIESTDPISALRIEETANLANPVWVEVRDVAWTQLPGNLSQAEFAFTAEPLGFYRVIDTAPPPEVPANSILVPFSLAPGEERRLHVLFHPDAVGAAVGTLRVGSNDPDEMTVDVALRGTGVVFNQWPVAGIKAEPGLPSMPPHRVQFFGSGRSSDADGQIRTYAWDFGDDGGTSDAADPTHDYAPTSPTLFFGRAAAARYIARLVVTDNQGGMDPTSVAVLVSKCPLRSRFYGTVGMLGLPAREGAVITARIGNAELARSRTQRHLGATVYASEVPPGTPPSSGDCPPSREGEEVQFLVDGIVAEGRGTWHHAWDQELDLHIPLNIGLDWGLDWLADRGDVRFQFERGSVSDVTIIDFVNLPAPSHAFDQFANHAFRIEARRLDGTPVTQFERPYRLTVNYADTDWQSAGIADENRLNLHTWNGVRWQPILPCPDCQLDTVANRLTVELNHLTEFALGTDDGTSTSMTITLRPVADSYILSSSPTMNFGLSPILDVGRRSSASHGRGLFRFELSAIPRGATVESATFQAYLLQGSPAPATLAIELRRIDTAWQEGTVAWATPLNYTDLNNVAGVGTAMDYSSWNVTSLVQSWVNGSVNHGLALFSQNEGSLGWRGFASRERTVSPPSQPRLVVTYRP